jgi:hypothetical protein
MKRLNLAAKIFVAGMFFGGTSLSPAQALGFNNGNSKPVAPVAVATSIVDSTKDTLIDSNSDPKDLPRLNPSNLSISTGRDEKGNLLVTDSGTVKFVEQANSNSAPKALVASATPTATSKSVDGIGFNPKIRFSLFAIDNTSINTFYGSSAAPTLNQQYSQLYNQYILVPGVSMSFFGKDQLMVTGVLSNYQANTPGCGAPLWSTSHFYCFQTQNSFQLFRAWYSFPINDNIRVMAGPRMYTYDLLPVSTAMYSPKGANMIGLKSLLFDFVDYASVPGTYPLTLGPGAGITFAKNGWALGGGFVAGNPSSNLSQVGMLDNNNGSTAVVQLSYTSARAGFQAAWTNTNYGLNPLGVFYFAEASGLAINPFAFLTPMTVNTAAIGGYYYIIPKKFSISGGMNYGFYTATASGSNPWYGLTVNNGDTAVSNAWLLTFQYEKLFTDSIAIGTSFGQTGMIKSNTSNVGIDNQATPPWMIIAFLNWQATKQLSITPYLYWATASNSLNYSTGGPLPTTSTFGGSLMLSLALY